MIVHIGRRVVLVAGQKALDEGFIQKLVRASCGKIRNFAFGGLAHNRGVAIRTDADHVGGCMRAKTAKPIAASAMGIVRKASNQARFAFARKAPSTS